MALNSKTHTSTCELMKQPYSYCLPRTLQAVNDSYSRNCCKTTAASVGTNIV